MSYSCLNNTHSHTDKEHTIYESYFPTPFPPTARRKTKFVFFFLRVYSEHFWMCGLWYSDCGAWVKVIESNIRLTWNSDRQFRYIIASSFVYHYHNMKMLFISRKAYLLMKPHFPQTVMVNASAVDMVCLPYNVWDGNTYCSKLCETHTRPEQTRWCWLRFAWSTWSTWVSVKTCV